MSVKKPTYKKLPKALKKSATIKQKQAHLDKCNAINAENAKKKHQYDADVKKESTLDKKIGSIRK
ncbi:MAG: hypothetical protein V4543_08455 [Bacteroidota bacterium]